MKTEKKPIQFKMENFLFLMDQIDKTGFKGSFIDDAGKSIALEDILMNKMKEGDQVFTLKMDTTIGPHKVTALLKFHWAENKHYFDFDSYRLTVNRPEFSEVMSKTFPVKVFNNSKIRRKDADNNIDPGAHIKNRNITLKEGYNLLCGGSVCKEAPDKDFFIKEQWHVVDLQLRPGQKEYETYILDPEQGYDFDLKKEIGRLPIQDLKMNELMESLKRGNLQDVIMVVNGAEFNLLLEVDAMNKCLIARTMGGTKLTDLQMEKVYANGVSYNAASKSNVLGSPDSETVISHNKAVPKPPKKAPAKKAASKRKPNNKVKA